MTNIVFASNSLTHWPSAIKGTATNTFAVSRVPYSIELPYETTAISSTFAPVTGEVSWIHFRYLFEGIWSADDFQFINAIDEAGNVLFSLKKKINSSLGDINANLRDGTTSTGGDTSLAGNINSINTLDIRYEQTSSFLNLQIYVNGGLALTLNLASNPSGFGQVARLTLGSGFGQNIGDSCYFSEILVADEDTRNARLNLLRPVAESGETDWLGSPTELADDDTASGMFTVAVNQRSTMTITAYTGSANISTLVIVSQGQAGANAPQNMRHTVRMGAVNYDSPADIPLTASLEYKLTNYEINPATTIPWIDTDLATLEIGFVSKA